jgi:hypothetical protein
MTDLPMAIDSAQGTSAGVDGRSDLSLESLEQSFRDHLQIPLFNGIEGVSARMCRGQLRLSQKLRD